MGNEAEPASVIRFSQVWDIGSFGNGRWVVRPVAENKDSFSEPSEKASPCKREASKVGSLSGYQLARWLVRSRVWLKVWTGYSANEWQGNRSSALPVPYMLGSLIIIFKYIIKCLLFDSNTMSHLFISPERSIIYSVVSLLYQNQKIKCGYDHTNSLTQALWNSQMNLKDLSKLWQWAY